MKILLHSFLLTILLSPIALSQSVELIMAKNQYRAYQQKGDYASALVWAEEALAIAEEEFGRDHETYTLHINDLAYLYVLLGRYGEAEPLHQRALSIREKIFGLEHPAVATSLNNIASLYATQGKYAAAESLHKRALAIREKTFGPEDFDVAVSLNNLALLYKDQGKYAEAEPLHQRFLIIIERTLGPEHPHRATGLNNLAGLYDTQGKYAKAEPLYRSALAIREKVLKPEHPDVALSQNNLAELYRNQGRYDEAEPLFRRALMIREKVLGLEHPDVAQSMNNLALLYKDQGKHAKAGRLLWRALEIRENSLGSYHLSVAISRSNLAGLYIAQGDYARAKSLLERAQVIVEKALGPEHQYVATSLNNLAELYRVQGRHDEAESLYQRSLAIEIKTLGDEHPHVAIGLSNLAELCRIQGRYAEAESLYQRSLAIDYKVLGDEHPHVATSLSSLGMLHWNQNQYDEAEPLFREAHRNLLNQIQRYFVAMSEDEKRSFYQTIDKEFEGFNSFVIRRKASNPAIATAMYNNQLAIKALLLNSTSKVRRFILNSDDNTLIELYEKWLAKKEYLAKVYTLSKAEIAGQGVNKESVEAAANDLEKQLSRQSEPFAAATDTTQFTWQDVKNKLQPGEAAVEMVHFNWFSWFSETWTDTVYYAALIVTSETKDYPELVLLENGNDLETQHFQEYLKSRKGKNNIAYQLYWQPIVEKLAGIEKVYFSPDGVYNKINLNILSNPETGEYVLDEIEIHLVTNTKDILQFDEKRESNKVAQLFGRPAYNLAAQQHLVAANAFRGAPDLTWMTDNENAARTRARFSDLPGTEKEIADIASVLTDYGWLPRIHLGPEALEEAVKAVDNPGVLHIATHGFFIESQRDEFRQGSRNVQPLSLGENKLPQPIGTDPMLRSGLVLAGAETYLNAKKKYDTDDGILTAYEAANLSLDQTELVVLSACETGLGEVQNGEGVYGLQRAFKVAGAKTILMSLWKVDDAATQELMTAFYEVWLSGGDKRHAFRKAQQQIRDKYTLPEYWGAFVMVGE